MEMKRGRGFTLIEMIVYVGLFLVVSLLLADLFSLSRRTQRTTASAYAVTGQTDTAMQWLRRDLQETALGSIRSYPGPTGVLRPAISFTSARNAQAGGDEQSSLLISEYGVPGWSYHVFYGLKRQAGDQTGSLIRWEVPLTPAESDRIPKVATMPNSLAQVTKSRVVLQNVLCPGQAVNRLNGLPNGWPASPWGGFRVEFVRRQGGEDGQESLSPVNPALNIAGAADNTRLVEVELGVSETSMAAPNFYAVKFRVYPRY